MSTYGTIKYTGFQDSGVVVGNTAYTNTVDLPTSDLEIGAVAFVSETSKMYMWTGSSWFNIAIANQAPTAISGNVASYDLAQDGTATTVTLTATDPEGLPLTWSSSVSGVTQAATVTNVDNVFTITPSTNDAHFGTINVTFSVTDGNNTETSLSSFILRFLIPNSQYTSTLVEATGTGTNLTFVDASAEAHTITNTDVVAGTFSPYRSGGYSTYFDGSSSLSIPNDATLHFGSGDYTVETWVYNTDTGNDIKWIAAMWHYTTPAAQAWGLFHYNGQYGFIVDPADTTVTTGTSGLHTNEWTHLAVTKSGDVFRMFINGVQEATTTLSHTMQNGSGTLDIGGAGAGPGNTRFGGYISNLRTVKGTAVYTSNFTPPTEPLTAITNTTLLTCHLPYIADGSTNAHAITVTGNVSTKPLTPFNNLEYSEALHGSSGYFGGNVDYLSIANDASYKPIANEDYTIESWVYLTATPSGQGAQIIGIGEYGTSSDWVVAVESNLGITHYINPSALHLTSAAGGVKLNSWNHIAVSRSGTSTNNTKIFINGELVAQGSYNSTLISTGSNLTLGGDANGDESVFTGYISDARIVRGTAVYTAAFTPPTAPLTAVTNTGFLMNPNPNIVDKAQKNNISLVGNVTSASPPLQIFGTPNAVSFDGSSLISAATPAAIGSQDYTIEFWMNSPNVTSTWQSLVSRDYNNSDSFRLYKKESTSELAFYSGSSVRATTSGAGLTNNVWHHIAVVRNSGTLQIYVDGVSKASASNSDDISEAAAPINIGGNTGEVSNYPFTGYISDLRIVTGTAVYTSNFTPPTENLTAIANTSLLTCQGSSIVDASTNAHTITVTGNAASVNLDPYGTEKVTTFDGTGDYLVVSSSSTDYGYGTGDFTIELWVYFNSVTVTQTVVSNLTSASSTNPHLYLLDTDSKIKYYDGGGDRITSSALSANTWYHVALSRASGSTKLFIDGTQSGSTYTDSNNYGTTAPFVVGTYYSGGSLVTTNPLNGYVQDVRVTKGLARYTNSFTPPTVLLKG